MISNMLISIKNAYLGGRGEVSVPYSKMKLKLAKVLAKKGFIDSAKKEGRQLLIKLKFIKRKPVFTNVKLISKPSLRVYVSKREIPRVFEGGGVVIISTNKGLLSGEEARKIGLGGELICKVW